MTPETLHPCAHRIALTYPFTEHCWPFGPEYDVFKVDGRIFMITMTIRGRALVNLKAEGEEEYSEDRKMIRVKNAITLIAFG